MSIHSLTILHYGKDYISYALRSIYHEIDQAHIFYTPTASHGHSTDLPPIDTKEELQQAVYSYDPDNKIKWYDMIGVTHEGPQRDMALQTVQAAGADLVLVQDYDEIWPNAVLKNSLTFAQTSNVRNNLINMVHFWRSFDLICRDQGWPVRIINLMQANNEVAYIPHEPVYHFGYAVTSQTMAYKWQIHGHKNELRLNWFEDKWYKWPAPDDCHPTNDQDFWTPELFDKTQLPEFMRQHPFYDLEKIE